MQVDARLFLVALHNAFRDTSHGADFDEREAAEKRQIDNLVEDQFYFGAEKLVGGGNVSVFDRVHRSRNSRIHTTSYCGSNHSARKSLVF